MKKQCFIVGGGPSLTNFDWSLLDGKITIAINNAYKVLPNASIVYFTDNDWWNAHKEELLAHKGVKIKGSTKATMIHHPKVKEYELTKASGLELTGGCLAHGYNSVHAAINLAVVLGFKEIYLLGVDMGWQDGKSHWHDEHTRVDPESAYAMMKACFDVTAQELWARRVEVINLNPDSKLECFPKRPYNEIIGV